MKKLSKRLAVLVLIFVLSTLFASNLYAGSPNVIFVVDAATSINGVAPQQKAQITYGSGILQLEVRSVNLPDGTPLSVTFSEHESVSPYGLMAPVTIATLPISKGQVKADINWAGMLPGTIDGLVISAPDGTVLVHSFPMVKN